MSGPIPTGDSKKQSGAIPSLSLPASGRVGEIPDTIVPLSEVAEKLYRAAWKSPAAAAWGVDEAETVAEWAEAKATLRLAQSRGEKVAASDFVVLRSLEDRLLMSALAKQRARAKYVDDAKPSTSSVPADDIAKFGGTS